MDKFKNLPKGILRYNVETLSDIDQTDFWECYESNAPIEHFNLKPLDYKLVVTFDQDMCIARYCLFDNGAFNYNDYLFETSAESLDGLGSQIKKSLEVLIEAGFLTERYYWKWEKLGIGEDTLSGLFQYYHY